MAGSFVEQLAGTAQPLPGSIPHSTSYVENLASGALSPGGPQSASGPHVPDAPTNPFNFIAGAVYNTFAHGIPNIIKGLQGLIGVGVHDIGGAVLQAIPGEQGGWERQIQEQGYQTPQVLGALPGALTQDYASRYGFHGPGEAVDRFYDDPMAYILDALMVGQVVSKGAKIGEMAGLVAPETAAKIRGISSATEEAAGLVGLPAKPTTPVGSLVGTGLEASKEAASILADYGGKAEITAISTSTNPVTRWVQNTALNKLFTRAADEVDATNVLELGLGTGPARDRMALSAARLKEYQAANIRVLKPWAEQFTQGRVARHLFGLSQDRFYGIRNEFLNELNQGMNDIRLKWWGDTVKGLQGKLSPEEMKAWIEENNLQTIKTIQDQRTPLAGGAPEVLDTLEIPTGSLVPRATAGEAGATGAVVPQSTVMPTGEGLGSAVVGDFDVWNKLNGIVSGDLKDPKLVVSPTRVGREMPDGTYLPPDGARLSYDAPLAVQDDIGPVSDRIVKEFGIVDEPYLEDHFRVAGSSWQGQRVSYHLPDGRWMDVNFGTPELLRAQKNAWHIMQKVPELQSALSTEAAVIAVLGMDGTDPAFAARAAQAAANVSEEVEAAQTMLKHMWQYPMRKIADAYTDGHVEAADFLRNWEYDVAMKTWIEEYKGGESIWKTKDGWLGQGEKGPYTVALERAYGPRRLEMFDALNESIYPEVWDAVKNSKNTEQLRAQLAAYLIKRGLQEGQDAATQEAFGRFYMGIRFKKNLSISENVDEIMTQFRRSYRQPIVVDSKTPGFTWRDLYATGKPGREMLPGYFPHIRAANTRWSDMMAKSRSFDDINTEEPIFARGWRGYLLENDMLLKDVEQAYGRVGAAYLRHQEAMDLIDQIVARNFTRVVHPDELKEIIKNGKMTTGEVLWVPDAIKRKMGLHSQIVDEIFTQLRSGADQKKAIENAVNLYADHILEWQAKNIGESVVYAVPKVVADAVSKQVKSTFGAGTLQLFWDGPINLWRSAVLGMNPRWVLYNEMGNIIFTGIKDPAALRRIFSQLRKNDKQAADLILGESTPVDLSSGGFVTKEHQLMGAKHRIPDDSPFINFANKTYAIRDSKAFNPLRWWTGKVFNANTAVETAARKGVIIDTALKNYLLENGQKLNVFQRMFMSDAKAMKLISEKGITEEMANELLRSVNNTLGNYTALSSIERSYIRRFFMPFYPFYRHIVKFALKMPYENPAKAAVFRLLEEVDTDMQKDLPGFLQGAVYLGQLGGQDAWFRTQNFNPLDVFTNPRGQMVQTLGPVWNTLLSSQYGQDALGRPYKDPSVYESPGGLKIQNGQVFEGTIHPSWLEMLAANFPQAQLVPWLRYDQFGKNSTMQTRIMGLLGAPVTRYPTSDYQMRALLAKMQALTNTDYLAAQ